MEILDIALVALILMIAWSLMNEGDDGGKRSRGRAMAGAAA